MSSTWSNGAVQSADTSGRHTIQVEMSMDDAILSPTEEVSGQKNNSSEAGQKPG